jgi:asparagine synthase (glutamine-hydrolysing)
MRQQLYSPAFKRELQGYSAINVFREHAANAPTEDPLSLAQYLDFKTWLPGDILTKVDRASMAHSLEVRVPVLDHRLAEWASCLPPGMKLHHGEGKFIFKKMLEPDLPHEVLYRPKMGFRVPLAAWFRGALRDRLRNALLEGEIAKCGYFVPEVLENMVRQHVAGQRDYSATLWSLLMLDAFLRNLKQPANSGFFDKPSQDAATAGAMR